MAVFRRPESEGTGGPDSQAPREASASDEGNDRGRGGGSFWWFLVQHLGRNRSRIIGVVIGLWAGFGIMGLGLLWTLFISLCVGVGYFIGKRLDDNHEDLMDFLDRVLPPGRG